MDLPLRILTRAATEPVIAVDGLVGGPGLQLSHWPGHDTPTALRHDLSTGCALRFARLRPREQARLAGGAVAIANNHYDTDGCLALFAVRHPERALPHAEAMLAAARAGDFFQIPDERALAVDALVAGLADPEHSPLDLADLTDPERWEACARHLAEAFPDLLAAEALPFSALWEPVVEAARADVADLKGALKGGAAALDLATWTAREGATSSRDAPRPREPSFDPGRHALFGSTHADRVLVAGPRDGGTTFRLVVSTLSWFDLQSERRLPRPDLPALAQRLNELEGTDPQGALAWRGQPSRNASPELWFGGAELDAFAEHNPALAPSRLAPDVVRAELGRALS